MTGWTTPQIDDEPLSRIVSMFEYWADHPPVHELVAGYMGIKPRPIVQDEVEEEDKWWETIEDECANQDIGGFAAIAPVRVG